MPLPEHTIEPEGGTIRQGEGSYDLEAKCFYCGLTIEANVSHSDPDDVSGWYHKEEVT
jgi:hypothetical protein